MNRRRLRMVSSVAVLMAASLVLTGCPKKSAPQAGADATTTRASVGAGGGVAGGAGSAVTGSGLTSVGAASGAESLGSTALGSAVAGGTAIPALPSPKEFTETAALRDIHFDFDQYVIRPQETSTLEANARWLKSNTNALVLIEGHADERGTNEYNLVLGERRAKITRDHLVSLGVDAARITLITYGEERPSCGERTEACWAKNRRAHFLVKQ